MALVSVRPITTGSAPQRVSKSQDPDLTRAETLLQLHQTVKVAYSAGTRPGNFSEELKELRDARMQVHTILQRLDAADIVGRSRSQETSAISVDDDDDETAAWS